MIQHYFTQTKLEFDQFTSANFVLNVSINLETRPGNQAFISGYVIFLDRSSLFFREYLDATTNTVDKLMYSYHYQEANNTLIFRYDNAQHKPRLPFLEHKHTPPDPIQHASTPTIHDVLLEIAAQRRWI